MTKPALTLAPHIKKQIDEIFAPLRNPLKWASLGIPFAPSPSAIIRMEGAPGTGKTALANHMARKLTKAPLHISFAGVASNQFGATEAKIASLFATAHETEQRVIIMEECDAILWSRDNINEDTMYILGIVNTLLIEIDKFVSRQIPSLLILTSNYPQILDAALERRVTDVIRLEPPRGELARKMWLSKLPSPLSHTIQDGQLNALAALGATPDQMEKAILKICRRAMHENREPMFSDFGLPSQ